MIGDMFILYSIILPGVQNTEKRFFMRSKVARELDSAYNPMQWAGEEYLLEEFADEWKGR